MISPNKLILFTSILFAFACSDDTKEIKNEENAEKIEYVQPEKVKDVVKFVSELIDGPANVRDTINGDIVFTLLDNAPVQSSEPYNDWFIVGVWTKVTNYNPNYYTLDSGSFLISFDGDTIGKVFKPMEMGMTHEENEKYFTFISGYTYKNNIKPESIIEFGLSDFIQKSSKPITTELLKPFIEKYALIKCSQNSMGDDDGNWYFKWQSEITDISPRDRITLIIEKNELIGIVHSRDIEIPGYKSYEIARGHSFLPIKTLTESELESILNERRNWYNSID